MVKIAIVGSRTYADLDAVRSYVSELPADTIIVSGGASGVDLVAEDAAHAKGLQTVIFPAQWQSYGKRAGMVRNAQIVAEADQLVAFWDGVSKGTKNSIDLARKKGIPVRVEVRQ